VPQRDLLHPVAARTATDHLRSIIFEKLHAAGTPVYWAAGLAKTTRTMALSGPPLPPRDAVSRGQTALGSPTKLGRTRRPANRRRLASSEVGSSLHVPVSNRNRPDRIPRSASGLRSVDAPTAFVRRTGWDYWALAVAHTITRKCECGAPPVRSNRDTPQRVAARTSAAWRTG